MDFEAFRSEFKRRFTGFCSHTPVDVSFLVDDISATILVPEKGLQQTFVFSFTESVKTNISYIREWLSKNAYPTIHGSIITERPYTPDELSELIITENISLDDAMTRKREETEDFYYRIEKVFHRDNNLSIRDLKKGKSAIYHMRMPVSLFVETAKVNPEQAVSQFLEHSEKTMETE